MNRKLKELSQDDFILTIIKDLGMINGKRKAIFKCYYCNNHYEATVGDVKRDKSTRCSICTASNKSKVKLFTTDIFIKLSHKVHNCCYDYSKSIYTGTDNKLIIRCRVHGEFEQRPHQHLRGEGCKQCGYNKVSTSLVKSFTELVKIANTIHDNKYRYDESSYKGSTKKMNIICKKHGLFRQALSNHIHNKHGCPACKSGGFASNLPAKLYYIKLLDYNLYKIGVTNKNISSRFYLDDIRYEVLFCKPFKSGKDCIDVETLILNNYKEYKYNGPDVIKSGNTEIFKYDIFEGEYDAIKSDIRRKNLSSKRNVSRCQYSTPC